MRHEFKTTLRILKANLQCVQYNLKDTRTLIKMCEGKPDKQNYKRKLQRSIAGYQRDIIELTRAIKILNRNP